MMTSRRTFDDDILKSQPVSVVFLFSQLDCGIFFGIFVAATSDVFFFLGGGGIGELGQRAPKNSSQPVGCFQK